jgi:acetone carboxylase gamma subunit
MEEYRPPLRIVDGSLCCSHCGERLAPIAENWKERASARSTPLSEKADDLGALLKAATTVPLVLWEISCPGCATLLDVEVGRDGEPPEHDIRLGVIVDEPGEPF